MDYQLAQFIRFIGAEERSDDLLNDAKAETWTRNAELAVLRLEDNRRVLIRGGRDGIELQLGAGGQPVLMVEGIAIVVAELIWHTHPRATGPSDFDRQFLGLLGQECSTVHEINGMPGGTLFYRIGSKDQPVNPIRR